jgi:hypothetical protein
MHRLLPFKPLALQRALDQAIKATSNWDAETEPEPSQWRSQDYLQLRYREGMSHKDIAQHIGYSEQQLLDLRKELLLKLTKALLNNQRD